MFYILLYCWTQCALCVYKPLLLTYSEGEEVGALLLKLLFPLPDIFQTLPCHTRGDAVRFIWIHLLFTRDTFLPPTLSLSLWVLLLSQHQRGTAFGQQSSLQDWAPPQARSNLPRFRLSLFAKFTAPCVFSCDLSPLDDGEDKHVAYRITELWQKRGSAQ